MNRSKIEIYIGDGVYASFDGFQIWLRTERALTNPPNAIRTVQHVIALDVHVFGALRDYAEGIWRKGETND